MQKLLFLVFFLTFSISPVFADIGVGVGAGKIDVDETLKPGIEYTLPPITVFNTGSEPSEYYMSVEHSRDKDFFQPPEKWFSFYPNIFYLEPGATQIVSITLNIPLRGSQPGSYFAFLTAQPKSTVKEAGSVVGVAAATKAYFTVEPANIFQALQNKIIDLFVKYQPWSYIALGLFTLILLLIFLRKRFKIQIVKK